MDRANPMYARMIEDAIRTLGDDKTGSSRAKIKKTIERLHKIELIKGTFRSALAAGVKSGKLLQRGQLFCLAEVKEEVSAEEKKASSSSAAASATSSAAAFSVN